MQKFYVLTTLSIILIVTQANAQVGIGTPTPDISAMLHVDVSTSTSKGFLVTGNAISGTVPNLGAGSRLMFYPGKAAFRAGNVGGTQWDDANVGFYSTAMGYNTTASGTFSTAMGNGTTATGAYSFAVGYYTNAGNSDGINSAGATAMGFLTTAKGIGSTAIGYKSAANGGTSIAMGSETIASGDYSIAMGIFTNASGRESTALGSHTSASGIVSTSMGSNTTASGIYSTAMGSDVNTNGQQGAFIIGDNNPNGEGITFSGKDNEFVARFNNGYYLLTTGDGTPLTPRMGVQIGHNGNAWVSICDKNRKENFEQLDGEDVLQKIAKINFTSWNYKQQDPKIYRHYGIMAQDFYNAFGKDKFGTIGNDTTVNPIDMIGIDMTAIQALEKRTNELKNQNAVLNKKVAEVDELKKENENLKQSVARLQTQFDQQQKLIAQSLDQLKTLALKQAIKETVAVK
ncbi:MAG: tail fiber domain-containing protein [Chitinophagaceae bacterium]|nr:tail fiber domain-containing protein [Chitinophagaceae bacterium]